MPKRSSSWLLVPTLAVAVRVDLGEGGVLDALERAIVDLVKIRDRTQYDLARLLCMPEEVVASAVTRLISLGMLQFQDGRVAVGQLDKEDVASDPHVAWVVLDPHTGHPMKRLLLQPPPLVSKAATALPQFTGDGARFRNELKERVLQERLSLLTLEGELPVLDVDGEVVSASENGESREGQSATFRGSVNVETLPIQSILLEGDGARPVLWKDCYAWVQVEFLQQLVGPAVPVFHEPDVLGNVEGLEARPINQLWAERCSPELHRWIEDRSRRFEEQNSLVLRLVGIESAEHLDSAVDDHYESMRTKLGPASLVSSAAEKAVLEDIRAAIGWLIIAQREASRYYSEAWRAYGYAIESCFNRLGGASEQAVDGWVRDFHGGSAQHQAREAQRLKEKGFVDGRLQRLGLREALALGGSDQHLREHTQSIKKLAGYEWGKRHKFGAGDNVVVWLLPLVLLDDEGAKKLAQSIQALLVREQRLFGFISALIQVRNDAFHIGERSSVPEDLRSIPALDQRLLKVWFAIVEVGVLK